MSFYFNLYNGVITMKTKHFVSNLNLSSPPSAFCVLGRDQRFKKSFRAIALIGATCLLSGCIAAIPFIPLAIEGAAALSDHQSGQFKDVEIVPSRGYTHEDIAQIETMAFSSKDSADGGGYSFLSADTIVDNLVGEFIKAGYDVIEGAVMQATMEENNLKPTRAGIAKAAEIAGVQAVVTVRTETGSGFKRGFLGIGTDVQSGVLGASMRFIDPTTSKTILVATASYKKPKRSADVANNIAAAFAAYQKQNPANGETDGS